MNNSEFYIVRDEEYLEHHGIKGQKWGIRRYQNSDGSLTDEGKQRYGVDSNGKMSKEGEKLYNKDLNIAKNTTHITPNEARLKVAVAFTAAGSTFVARKLATGDFIPGGFGVEKGVKGIHWIKDVGKSTATALAAGGLGYLTMDSIYAIKSKIDNNKEVNTNGAT